MGARIRADREAKGLTQEQLAAALGTSRFQVIRWEGDRNAPEGYAERLSEFFGRPADYFVTPREKPLPGSREDLAELRGDGGASREGGRRSSA